MRPEFLLIQFSSNDSVDVLILHQPYDRTNPLLTEYLSGFPGQKHGKYGRLLRRVLWIKPAIVIRSGRKTHINHPSQACLVPQLTPALVAFPFKIHSKKTPINAPKRGPITYIHEVLKSPRSKSGANDRMGFIDAPLTG